MGVAKMAGLRKFPQLTSSYSHTRKEASHKEEKALHKARPSSAPSSPQTGRHLLASRQPQNKSYYKVTYPLRNRRKVNLKNPINAAPNAEYIVTGRGYTFTRHNNKLTMNIDTEVFFDDTVTTSVESGVKRKPSSPGQQPPNKVSLQKQLEESIQIREKLHRALIEASVKLEEQKLEQDDQKTKMLEQHDAAVKELKKLHAAEKRKLMKAHEEMLFNNETKHASKLADHQAATANREILMKKDIQNLKDEIAGNNSRHEVELVDCIKRKEEELNAINLRALSDLKTEMTNDYKKQLSSRIRNLEKEHERTLAEETVRHKNEIEDLISRFKDSAQIEDDFKKTSKLLKECETEMEHLTEEKKQMTIELRSCKAQLQEIESELQQYKRKFQSKVDEVKEQCDNTINQLTIENTELRKRLLRKTEELSDLRMEEDKRLRSVQFNLKKSIIQARIKANLPMALGLQEQAQDDETKDRQGSAPITRQEKDSHRKRLSSVEQEQPSESTHFNRTPNRTPEHKQPENKR